MYAKGVLLEVLSKNFLLRVLAGSAYWKTSSRSSYKKFRPGVPTCGPTGRSTRSWNGKSSTRSSRNRFKS